MRYLFSFLLSVTGLFGQDIAWLATATKPIASTGGSGTIGPISIAADGDDGEVWSSFFWDDGENNDGVGVISFGGANYVWGFFRFVLPSAIPSGSTITDSRLELWGESSVGWINGASDLRVYCNDSANAAAPTAGGDRPSLDGGSTSTTTASVNWNDVTWTLNAWNESPSLATMIQELVTDNGGLSSGAGIVLWVACTTTAQALTQLREFVGEDNVARLTITYE
jgi:hypothetical protein